MDTGAISSGRLYVLNCLTMQAYGFTQGENGSSGENGLSGENGNALVKQFEVIQF